MGSIVSPVAELDVAGNKSLPIDQISVSIIYLTIWFSTPELQNTIMWSCATKMSSWFKIKGINAYVYMMVYMHAFILFRMQKGMDINVNINIYVCLF